MPKERGSEWDYVTFFQPKGKDGVKQEKCKVCEHVLYGGAAQPGTGNSWGRLRLGGFKNRRKGGREGIQQQWRRFVN
eukprot:1160961-Pelagomonas_calceolata.AAC.4